MSAKPARHLALVDQTTGEVVDSRELAELQAALEKAKADLKNAEKDLRVKRATITQLQADKVAERLEHPQRDLILGICKYWHQVCRPEDYNGRHRIVSSSPDRFDAVAALVEMERIVRDESAKGKRRREWVYEREHFAAAINGAAFDPFETVHKNGKVERHNDLSQICKDVTRFERAIAKCPYEVVPILPARVPPGAVDLHPVTRNNPHTVPDHPSSLQDGGQAHVGGSDGSSCVGKARGRVPVHVEASGLVMGRWLEAGAVGEPAA